MKILIVVAMMKEAEPIIQSFLMKKSSIQLDNLLNTCLYSCFYQKHEIYLTTSGKDVLHKTDRLGSGVIPAVTMSIQAIKPDLLINIGSAGGFSKKGAQRGDIYLSIDTFKFHDRLFEPDYFHQAYGIGSYPSYSIEHIAKKLHLKIGIVSTGGSMLASQEEQKQIERNQATLKDMEAAHVAQVAHIFQTPMFAIKGVTDLVDTDECPQEQFTQNIHNLSKVLAETLINVVTLL